MKFKLAIKLSANVFLRSLPALAVLTALSALPVDSLTCLARKRAVSAQGQDSLVWEKPQEVVRQPKKYQKKKPMRGKQTVPLLALRVWVLKRDAELNPVATNPNAVFQIGDRLQLAVQANQNGYLYLVQDDSGSADASLLFPDSRINDGQNFVKKEQRIIVPSNCEEKYNDERGNCWWKVTDKDDNLTIIFSREMLMDIPDNLAPTVNNVKVKRNVIKAISND